MGYLKQLWAKLLTAGQHSADAAARNRLRQRCGTAACGLEKMAESSDSPDQ